MYKEIILSKIYEYCKETKHPARKSGSVVMLQCPFCDGEELTANVIPNTTIINCLKCHKKYSLLDIVKYHLSKEEKSFSSDEEIFEYLKNFLKLDVQTRKEEDDLEKLLDRYEAEGFCLVPCAKKDKNPIQKGWTEKENKNKQEWIGWIVNGLNVGVRTGSVSGITVIDLDILTKEEKAELVKKETSKTRKEEILSKKIIPEEIKLIMGNPLIQETLGGFHLFYKYTNLPKTRIKRDGYYIDLENDGGLIVIAPAPEVAVYEEYKEEDKTKKRIVGYAPRSFINGNEISSMPAELEELLIEASPLQENTSDPESQNTNRIEQHKVELLDEGDGRNVLFTSYAGYLLRRLNVDQVEYSLHGLNKLICKTELPWTEIKNIARNMQRYDEQFYDKLAVDIIDYLRLAESASRTDIEIAILGKRATGEDKKRIDETLVNLTRGEKIIRRGRQYMVLPNMNWTGNITKVGIPVNFKVPYFHDYAHFNYGDLILIGAKTKFGKTALAMNFIKRLVKQGIRPHYIYYENGGRWSDRAISLGLKDDDFLVPDTIVEHIDEIKFEKNSVTVWDWIDPPDFAKTNHYFSEIVKKIEKTQSLLIGFVQLKDNNEWFAPNMIRQRPALAVKYLYENENDGTKTKFVITEIRAPKAKGKQFTIPCVYDFKTKEVMRYDEIEEKRS